MKTARKKPGVAPRQAEGPACPACGIKYANHLGLTGTCAKLLMAIEVLRVIADPRADLPLDGRSIDRVYEDMALKCLNDMMVSVTPERK